MKVTDSLLQRIVIEEGKKRHIDFRGIEGVGPKRRRALLRHFGGTKQIPGASLQEIAKVDGISSATAEQIYTALHND